MLDRSIALFVRGRYDVELWIDQNRYSTRLQLHIYIMICASSGGCAKALCAKLASIRAWSVHPILGTIRDKVPLGPRPGCSIKRTVNNGGVWATGT